MRGFTLIELMIVVAIIAILASIAIPSYRDFVLRGHMVDATNLLSAAQTNMERHFQDNRTYAAVGTRYPPCDANVPVARRTSGHFVLTCAGGDAPTGTAYTLRATGSGPVNNVEFTINATGARTTASLGTTGWAVPAPNSCWVVKRGQTC